MNDITNTTFKSSLISVTLHASFLVLGSLALYQSPMKSLELTGGSGRNVISINNVSFNHRRSLSRPALGKNNVQTVSTKASAVSSAGATTASPQEVSTSTGTGISSGNENGNGNGNGHDFDQGKLFSEIKIFFEQRLGSTLNINVEQLIKIKMTITSEGEILTASLVLGKLDFQSHKKVINVAKSIPLNKIWNSSQPFPQELVIPLILTPNE